MRIANLATCLALACSPALAENHGRIHTWTGTSLRYPIPSFRDCRALVMVEASSFNGAVNVELRNNGPVAVGVTLEARLYGAPPAVSGVVNMSFRPGQASGRRLMTTTARDLTGSVLDLRITSCDRL
jgi:hypothetical protein